MINVRIKTVVCVQAVVTHKVKVRQAKIVETDTSLLIQVNRTMLPSIWVKYG